MDKGQVSIFIILGVVIFAIGGFLIFSQGQSEEVHIDVPSDFRPIVNQLEGCLLESFEAAVRDMALFGGRIPDVRVAYILSDSIIHYFYYDGYIIYPSFDEVYENVVNLSLNYFDSCSLMSDYEIERNGDSEILFSEVGNKSQIFMNYNAVIRKGSKEFALNELRASSDYRILTLLNISQQIINNRLEHPSFIEYTQLFELMKSYGVQINLLDFNESNVHGYQILDGDVNFMFATHFIENTPAKLQSDSIVMVEDEIYQGELISTDREFDWVTYDCPDCFFYYNSDTGYIYYTPSSKDLGLHMINISLFDGKVWNSTLLFVNVKETNDAPVLALRDIKAEIGTLMNYTILASDEEDDFLEYNLINSPPGMIASGKFLFWTPSEVGNYPVRVSVSDGNKEVFGDFNISVVGSLEPTNVSIIDPGVLKGKIGEQFKMNIRVEDLDGDLISFWDDSSSFDISSAGVIDFVPLEEKDYLFTIYAEDSSSVDSLEMRLVVE